MAGQVFMTAVLIPPKYAFEVYLPYISEIGIKGGVDVRENASSLSNGVCGSYGR